VNLVRRIEKHADVIVAAVELGLSNSRLEGINANIRLVPRRGYGFRDLDALTAAIYLCLGGVTLNVGEHPDLALGQLGDGLGTSDRVVSWWTRWRLTPSMPRISCAPTRGIGPCCIPMTIGVGLDGVEARLAAPGMNQCAAGSGPVGLA
jgi:hypothetical protein